MFSTKLKKLMTEKHITQAELAARSGLTKASISQYVNGKNKPKDKAIKALAAAFEVSESYLIDNAVEVSSTVNGELPMNITPKQAAKLMGVGVNMVRVNLQNGRLPFGYAMKGTGNKFTYSINTKQFMNHTGVTEQEVLGVL